MNRQNSLKGMWRGMNNHTSNTERMRYFIEQVQEKGRFELIEGLVRPDFRNHTVEPGQPADRAGIGETTAAMHQAFSGLRIEIVHCVGDGDLVATHKMFRGRHTGPWFGLRPSGNPVEFRVMDLVRFQDGQWAEHWAVADGVSLLRQTGALG